jgi:hypothetical protein
VTGHEGAALEAAAAANHLIRIEGGERTADKEALVQNVLQVEQEKHG